MSSKERRFRLPLYVSLFTIFLVLVATIIGGLSWHLYRTSAGAALDTADRLVAEVSDKIGQRTRRMFEAVEVLADATVTLPSLAQKADPLETPLLPYLLRLLDSHPGVYSVILGYHDGDVVQVIAVRGAELLPVLQSQGGPIGTRYMQRAIGRDDGGSRQETWRFLDAAGRVLGQRVQVDPAFDPASRPWYGPAFNSGERHVTEPYAFASLDTVGITLSRRFDGMAPGVIGFDLTLDSLSDFLAQQEVSPNTAMAILDADGHLLAHAEPGLVLRDEVGPDGAGSVRGRRHVSDLETPALARMLAELPPGRTRSEARLRFDVDGRSWLGATTVLQMGDGWEGVLLVAAPASDFVEPIERIQRDGLIAAGGAMLLALPLIWLVSRRIAAPLTALAQEAYRIRSLDLETPVKVRSLILEIERLALSVSAMKGALSVFVRYVPRGLVEQIVAEGGHGELGGQRREVTVMFSDITGFTAQSETLPPEDLMTRTSAYFEEVTRAITDHGGVVDKYIGDSVMALWNAPRTDSEHVAKACRAVLAVQARLSAFNARLAAAGEPQMPTRIGLHTGPCVIGNVGSSDRMNYTAIGANVNLAARLEGLARHYGTGSLVSDAVRSVADDDFLFRFVALVRPKGVSQAIAVHELLSHRDADAIARLAPMLAQWQQAMDHYRQRDFDTAGTMLAALSEADPQDRGVAQALVRCRTLQAVPPPADWDGIDGFSEK